MKASDLAFSASDLLKRAATRWRDEIPVMVLADISSALLAIASERLENAERLLIEVGTTINEP
jgi:hypothetical protein